MHSEMLFDPENGQKIAGLMDAERTKFVDLEEAFVEMMTTPSGFISYKYDDRLHRVQCTF